MRAALLPTSVALACLACGSSKPVPDRTLEAIPPTFNLGFESATEPEGWQVYGRDYTAHIDAVQQHEGRRSLRFDFTDPTSFAAVARSYPVEDLRGKRVRIGVHLRTRRTIAGWGRVWVDIASPAVEDGFESVDQRLWNQTDWTRYQITVDVPPGATAFHFGALLSGSGTGWIDGFEFEVEGPAGRRQPTRVAGTVVDESGQPVAHALVAVIDPLEREPSSYQLTRGDGRFSFETTRERYGVSITAPGLAAEYLPPESLTKDRAHRVAMKPATHEISGRAATTSGTPVEGVFIGLSGTSDGFADPFYARTNGDGHYTLGLGQPGKHTLFVDQLDHRTLSEPVDVQQERIEKNLTIAPRLPASADVIEDLRARGR